MGLALVSCTDGASTGIVSESRQEGAKKEALSVARGERLVVLAGCDSCHTPQIDGPSGVEFDYSKRLSGHSEVALDSAGPKRTWGNLLPAQDPNTVFSFPRGDRYATNLTPDQDTGVGSWNEQIFVDRMIESQHWMFYSRGTSLFVQSGYSTLTEEDLKSIFAYLGTLPPIRNRVPDNRSDGDWGWQ